MRAPSIKRVLLTLSILGAVTYAGCETTRMGDDSTGPSDGVATVQVAPATDTLTINETTQLTATPRSESGVPLSNPVSWASGSSLVASVSETGVVTALAAGATTIRATSEGKNGTALIVVLAAQPPPPPPPASAPVASVTVNPASASVDSGKTVQLSVTLRDANGNQLSGRTVTWTSLNTAAATVSASGLVTGVAPGTANVYAESEGQSDTAAITVVSPPPPPPSGAGVVFVGAGDIGDCGRDGKEQTAKLLDSLPGTVYTTGDNAYPDGTDDDFANCYHESWGRHRSRTMPSPGNHDYHTSGAAGYFTYYGANAGPAGRGYYSFDLGEWHIISLNSNISMTSTSNQVTWLKADLAANPKKCTLAFWHHPRFSSGKHGNSSSTQPLFQALYDADADVILAGHDHSYERFAPQTATGEADAERGIRQFVVGTGGRSFYSFGTIKPNSEARNSGTWGVLKLTLYTDRYEWEFIPVAGKTFTDKGTGMCH